MPPPEPALETREDLRTTILIVPRFAGDPARSSITKAIMLWVELLRPYYRILHPVPKTGKLPYEWPQHPDVTYIPIETVLPDFREEMWVTEEWYRLFNQFDGLYHYDLVLNFRTIISSLVDRLFRFTGSSTFELMKLPVPILHSPYIAVRTAALKRQDKFPEEDVAIERSLYLSPGRFVMHSPGEIELVREDLAEVFQPSVVRDVLSRSDWIGPFDAAGFERELQAKVGPHEDQDPPIVLSAGRASPVKNLPFAAAAMAKVAAKTPVKCIINTQTDPSSATVAALQVAGAYPRVEVRAGQSYDAYLQLLRAATCFVLSSRKESFCLTLLEAIAAGAVPVIKKEPWVRFEFLKDWPYLATTTDQMAEMIRSIVRTPATRAQAQALLSTLRQRMDAELALEVQARKARRLIDSELTALADYFNAGTGASLRGMIRETLTGSEANVDEAIGKLKTASTKGVRVPRFFARAALKYARGDYRSQ